MELCIVVKISVTEMLKSKQTPYYMLNSRVQVRIFPSSYQTSGRVCRNAYQNTFHNHKRHIRGGSNRTRSDRLANLHRRKHNLKNILTIIIAKDQNFDVSAVEKF